MGAEFQDQAQKEVQSVVEGMKEAQKDEQDTKKILQDKFTAKAEAVKKTLVELPEPDKIKYKDALAAVISELVEKNPAIIKWNQAHSDNPITADIINSWIFNNQAEPAIETQTETAEAAPAGTIKLELNELNYQQIELALNKGKTPPPFTTEDIKNLSLFTDKDGKITTKYEGEDKKDVIATFQKSFNENPSDLKNYLTKSVAYTKALEAAKAAPADTQVEGKDQPAENTENLRTKEQISTILDKNIPTPDAKGLNGTSDKGTDGPVHELQRVLFSMNKLYGFTCIPSTKAKPDGVDGSYGPKTNAAVKELQTQIKTVLMTKSAEPWFKEFAEQTRIQEEKFNDGNFGARTKQALQKFLALNDPTNSPEKPAKEAANPEVATAAEKDTKKTEVPPTVQEANQDEQKTTPEQAEINRIQANLDRLKSAPREKFIVEHPEILLWVATSPLGDNAKSIHIGSDNHAGGTKITLTINYTDGRSVYVPPSIVEVGRETYISYGKTDAEHLMAIKRALIQGPDRDQFIKVDNAQRTVSKAPILKNSPWADRVQPATSKVPNTLNLTEASPVPAEHISKALQTMAQEALGTKINAVADEATNKMVTYLQTLTQGTQAMDKKVKSMEKTEPTLAIPADYGIPLTIEDKEAILVAFIQDNKPMLEAIYKYQGQLETTLGTLKTDNLPKGTVPDSPGHSINFPATYEISVNRGGAKSTEYNQTLDFDDCTRTVVRNVSVVKDKDSGKTVITTTELNAQALAEGNPTAESTTTYTLEKPQVKVADSIEHTPKVPDKGTKAEMKSPKAIGNNWDIQVANTKEQITISPKNSDQHVTLDLDVKNSVEFKKGQWIDTSIQGLQNEIGQDVIKQIKQASDDTDLKVQRPIFKYEDDSSKVGYVIFDNETDKIITISGNHDVNIFKKGHKNSDETDTVHGLEKTKMFLGEDQKTLDSLTKSLSPDFRQKLDKANFSAIDNIAIDTNTTPAALAQQFATLAEKALGTKLPEPAKNYDEKSELGKFAKDVVKASKDHNNIVFSKAYKQILVAAFMKDNQEALGKVSILQENLRKTLFELGKSDTNKNLKLDASALTIQPAPGNQIREINGTKPVNEIDLSDNSTGAISTIQYSHKPNGGMILTIQKGAETQIYIVEKASANAPESLGAYDEKATQKTVTKFFESHGIKAEIGEPKRIDGSVTYPLVLNFNEISLQLSMDLSASAQKNTMISLYSNPSERDQNLELSTTDTLLKFPAIQNILRSVGPTPASAGETQKLNTLPASLEARVKDATAKLDGVPITLRAAGKSLELKATDPDLMTELHNQASKALGYKDIPATYTENSNLALFAEKYLVKIDAKATTIKLSTPVLREEFIRAFLKDNGSKLLGLGQDAIPSARA
jgi:hypothetical protein